MTCPHDLTERETAVMADGYCPLCLADDNKRLTAQNADLRRWKALGKPLTAAMSIVVTDMQELRTDNERLTAAIAYVRMRSAHACEVLNEFDNTRRALEPKP